MEIMKVAGEFKFKDFMNFKVTKSVLKVSYILVEHRNLFPSLLGFYLFVFHNESKYLVGCKMLKFRKSSDNQMMYSDVARFSDSSQ